MASVTGPSEAWESRVTARTKKEVALQDTKEELLQFKTVMIVGQELLQLQALAPLVQTLTSQSLRFSKSLRRCASS